MKFTKMQGIGNDYIYVNCFEETVTDPETVAKKISDRHFGVGSDGLVLICPDPVADFRMRMFNSDGSESEMCGNATRCIGKYVYERGLTDKTEISLMTGAGIKILQINAKQGKAESVRVDMGVPEVQGNGETVRAGGREFTFTRVSMGNPHAVSRDRIRMRVWERGAGETLACGTGACATLVAAVVNNLTDRKAYLDLNGGTLLIEWDEKTGHVFQEGPAEFVFDGEW